jgi:carbon monoxide dehydrogenase subunit G
MEFSGRYSIPAEPQVVWAALNDPDVLKSCIPGCESLAKTDPTHFAATAVLKIGPVKATFKANVEQAEQDPPRRCILRGEGQGGVAGFARGEAEIILEPVTEGTVLSYKANAAIGGKLAQIGQRLVDGAAKQIADDFFSKFAARVLPIPEAATGLPPHPEPVVHSLVPEVAQAEFPAKREGLTPEIWVVGLIAVVAILLALFGLVL